MTRRGLILTVYLPSFLLSFGSGLLIPTLPIYVRSYGVSFEIVSLVVAAAGLGTVISDVPSGLVVGRFGRRPTMIAGCALLVVTGLGLGFSRYVPELLLFRLLSGVGSSLWAVSRLTVLTEEVPSRERGRAISTYGGTSRFATFLGPAVGGLVATKLGLAAPFFLYSLVALVATILAVLFVHEAPHRKGKAPPPFHLHTVPRLLRQHYYAFSTAGLAQVFAQMIRAGRQLIIPLYAAYALGLDVGAVGTIVSLSSAVDMSLFYPAGLVMDRLGRRFAAIPSFFIQAMGMALIPFTHSYLALLAAALMLGLGNGLGSGSMMTLGADLAPKSEPGEFIGIWRLIGDAGTTGGPLVVGTVADTLGLGAAAFSLCGVGLLAVLMFVVFVRETLQKPATVTNSSG